MDRKPTTRRQFVAGSLGAVASGVLAGCGGSSADGEVYDRGPPAEVVTEELPADVFEIDADVEHTERGPRVVPIRPRHGDG